jgi:hypothetical protein
MSEYCSYINGKCAYGYNSALCRNRNPVECRNCRQQIERSHNNGEAETETVCP